MLFEIFIIAYFATFDVGGEGRQMQNNCLDSVCGESEDGVVVPLQ